MNKVKKGGVVKNFILFFILLIGSFCSKNGLYAELLILRKQASGIKPISDLDVKYDGAAITAVLLKYQWPMCITASLSDEEKNGLLTSGKTGQEESFIQEKINKDVDEDAGYYQVAFIPTVLYELFCIKYILDKPENDNDPIHSFINRVTLDRINQKSWVIDLIDLLSNDKKLSAQALRKKIYEIYDRYNKEFFNSIGLYIHQRIVKDLCAYSADFKKCVTGLEFSALLKNNSEKILELLLADLVRLNGVQLPNMSRDDYAKKYTTSLLERFKNERYNNIIAKVLSLEYEAREMNKGVLLRGTSFESFQIGLGKEPKKAILAGNTLVKVEKDETEEDEREAVILSFEQAYKDKKNKPYSISFGNSLFAGALLDETACAYTFLTGNRVYTASSDRMFKTLGYALLIDKKDYMDHQCHNLFFIAPCAPGMALLLCGEWFHSRTKAAVAEKPKEGINVRGVFGRNFQDPTSFIVVTRDPLKHAELFSRFLAENGRIIQEGDDHLLTAEEKTFVKEVVASQRQAATFYNAIRNIVPKIKRITKSYRVKKMQDFFRMQSVVPQDVIKALKSGETSFIEELIKQGLNVQWELEGEPLLSHAIFGFSLDHAQESIKTIKLLISKGASIVAPLRGGKSVILAALEVNTPVSLIEWLLDRGAPLKEREKIFEQALHNNESYEKIKLLLKRGLVLKDLRKALILTLDFCPQAADFFINEIRSKDLNRRDKNGKAIITRAIERAREQKSLIYDEIIKKLINERKVRVTQEDVNNAPDRLKVLLQAYVEDRD